MIQGSSFPEFNYRKRDASAALCSHATLCAGDYPQPRPRSQCVQQRLMTNRFREACKSSGSRARDKSHRHCRDPHLCSATVADWQSIAWKFGSVRVEVEVDHGLSAATVIFSSILRCNQLDGVELRE